MKKLFIILLLIVGCNNKKDNKCEIAITTKIPGTLVKFIKVCDYNIGKDFEVAGYSPVIIKIEKALYYFETWRNNIKTGKYGVVSCTSNKMDIVMEEIK